MAALSLGNPSSSHPRGQQARRALAQARQQVAHALGVQPTQVAFTSGATESNHLALLGALRRQQQGSHAGPRRRILLSAVEHAGFLALARRMQGQGVRVELLPVTPEGVVDLAAAERAMGEDVALISVMAANNETGALMPLAELAALAHAHGALLHSDATQLPGKHRLSFPDSRADLWSLSAHKLHGPKGVGALVMKAGLDWPAVLPGRQERGRRGGTENLPGIAGFGAACEWLSRQGDASLEALQSLRDRLEQQLLAQRPDMHIVSRGTARLANTSCVRFGTLPAEAVLRRLAEAGVCASSGAACQSGGFQPSHVQLALGATPEEARASLRFSLSRDNTADEIDRAAALILRAVQDSEPAALPPATPEPGAPVEPVDSLPALGLDLDRLSGATTQQQAAFLDGGLKLHAALSHQGQ
jgi:cysteine desulfurase